MGKGIAIASGTAADFSRTDSDDMILMGLPGRRQLLQITAQKGTERRLVFENILRPVLDVKA